MLYWHDKKCKRNNQHAVNDLLHRKVLLLSETIKLIDPAKISVSFFFFFLISFYIKYFICCDISYYIYWMSAFSFIIYTY